jgi:hypothetical protein
LFPTIWGICFSFKVNPNGLNPDHIGTVCARSLFPSPRARVTGPMR